MDLFIPPIRTIPSMTKPPPSFSSPTTIMCPALFRAFSVGYNQMGLCSTRRIIFLKRTFLLSARESRTWAVLPRPPTRIEGFSIIMVCSFLTLRFSRCPLRQGFVPLQPTLSVPPSPVMGFFLVLRSPNPPPWTPAFSFTSSHCVPPVRGPKKLAPDDKQSPPGNHKSLPIKRWTIGRSLFLCSFFCNPPSPPFFQSHRKELQSRWVGFASFNHACFFFFFLPLANAPIYLWAFVRPFPLGFIALRTARAGRESMFSAALCCRTMICCLA